MIIKQQEFNNRVSTRWRIQLLNLDTELSFGKFDENFEYCWGRNKNSKAYKIMSKNCLHDKLKKKCIIDLLASVVKITKY